MNPAGAWEPQGRGTSMSWEREPGLPGSGDQARADQHLWWARPAQNRVAWVSITDERESILIKENVRPGIPVRLFQAWVDPPRDRFRDLAVRVRGELQLLRCPALPERWKTCKGRRPGGRGLGARGVVTLRQRRRCLCARAAAGKGWVPRAGAVGRERAPAPAPAPTPAPPAPGPRLPIDPRGRDLGLLRSLPGSGLQVRDRRGGGRDRRAETWGKPRA